MTNDKLDNFGFGAALECGGYLSSLRRTRIGDYLAAHAMIVDEFVKSEKLLTPHS